MRVLQLISQTALGGAEAFGQLLAGELVRRGHEVWLLANRDNGPLFRRSAPEGLVRKAFPRRSRSDPGLLAFLTDAVRSFRPEVIHSHNFGANTWARALGLLYPRLGVVCHEHSGLKIHQRTANTVVDRLLYPRCQAVCVVNEELARLMHRRFGVSPARIHVVPNGIDTRWFAEPPGTARARHEVVCVASLTPVKNHEGILRAWRRVQQQHPAARLILVGDGPLRASLQAQADALGLHESVHFAGLLDDVRPRLWSASVFLLFSHREGLPLSILEAMAAGLVCVVPRLGGIPQVIEEGRIGHLLDPGDEAGLAQRLLERLTDTARTLDMGREAARTARERHDLADSAQRVEEIYRRVRS